MHPTLPVEYLCSIAADLHHAQANYLYLEIQRALGLRLKEEITKLLPTYPRPIRGCGGSVKVKGRRCSSHEEEKVFLNAKGIIPCHSAACMVIH